MKIRSLILFLLFFISSLAFAEEEKGIVSAKLTRGEIVDMLKTELAEMTQETSPFAIFGIEEIMNQEIPSILHAELDIDPKKFTDLKQKSCVNAGTNLVLEIVEMIIPFHLIDELENILLLCDLSYAQVGTSSQFLEEQEKKAYIILAKETWQKYSAAKNEIYLRQFRHFLNAGQLNAKDVGMQESDLIALK